MVAVLVCVYVPLGVEWCSVGDEWRMMGGRSNKGDAAGAALHQPTASQPLDCAVLRCAALRHPPALPHTGALHPTDSAARSSQPALTRTTTRTPRLDAIAAAAMLRAFLVRHRLTPGGLLTALLTIILSIYLIYAYSENKCNVVSILLVRSAHSPPPPPPPSSVTVPRCVRLAG